MFTRYGISLLDCARLPEATRELFDFWPKHGCLTEVDSDFSQAICSQAHVACKPEIGLDRIYYSDCMGHGFAALVHVVISFALALNWFPRLSCVELSCAYAAATCSVSA
eukprot:6205825-Pleurochrysis_carterae.AAC.3